MVKRNLTVGIISYFYSPIFPGYGTRVAKMICDLFLRMGYDVKVITAMPPNTKRKGGEKYGRGAFKIEKVNSSLTVYRFWTPEMKLENNLHKLYVYLWFLAISHLGLLITGKMDIVIRVGPYPPLLIFPEFLYRKIKKVPLLLHLGDLWPDVLFTFVKIKSKLAKKLLLMVSLLSYRLSSGIITITSSIRDGITNYGIHPSNVVAIELGVDCDTFRPIDSVNLHPSLPKDDKFIVMYSGNFGPAYDFDTLLQSAKVVSKINTNILFIIRGSGALESSIRNKILEKNLSNVIVLGVVNDVSELVQILNAADIFVLPMSNVKVQETAHPSKVFEYLAVGKPVVCCALGELKELIVDQNLGLVVNPEDPEALAKAILDLYNNSVKRELIGKKGREFVCNNFSHQAIISKWSDFIDRYSKGVN